MRSAAPARRSAKRNGVRTKLEREPRLNEHEIIEHTLRLIRADGVTSLSMRRLAQELSVAPMSLYHYVRNKDELLDRVVDALLSRIPSPEPQRENWQQQLRAYGMAILEQLSWHPGIARVVTERPPTLEGRRLIVYVGDVLLAAGFTQHKAALCLATFNTFLYGVLSAQAQMPSLVAVATQRAAARAASQPAAKPKRVLTGGRAVGQELFSLSFREWSQFGIDAFLASIAHELDSEASPARRPVRSAVVQSKPSEPS
jgi:AcrR family transcriptional regulator